MDEKRKDATENSLADVITGKPHEFAIGEHSLKLYPVTLAKLFLLKPYLEELGIDSSLAKKNICMEALRIATKKKEACCAFLSIHTSPNSYSELFDLQKRAARRKIISLADREMLASMMIYVLTCSDKTQQLMEDLGINEERRRMERVMAFKREKGENTMVFGGKSIFGSFIGQLKEMNYSVSEILYECPYSFLSLALADKITSVYLTDEERESLPMADGGKMVDANDPQAIMKLKNVLSGRGVKFND